MSEHIVVLVGSPKGPEASASGRLAKVMIEVMQGKGWSAEWMHIHHAVSDPGRMDALLAAIDNADMILLATPLYVDSLPAPVIQALERITEHRLSGEMATIPCFAALVNCGFVEPVQNATCQGIIRQFAEGARFEWYGGLSIGAAGQMPKRILQALQQAGGTLALNLPLSSGLEELTMDPIMSKRIYVLGGNAMWKRSAKKLGTLDRLRDRPYRQEPAKKR